MRGFLWALIAVTVADGRSFLPAHSTGSPDLAAQAAAGCARSGRVLGATTTWGEGVPLALICAASMAWASAAGSPPAIADAFRPSGPWGPALWSAPAAPPLAAPAGSGS